MGIFLGDSIYNYGGGGGGYKDGGELIDGDFINVTNNTISTYENTARNEINFVINDIDTSSVINAVIELENTYNNQATINVYFVKDGFYYPLGNVGGNTVSANSDYSIQIIGDSFIINQVSSINNNPEYVVIDNKIIRASVSAEGTRIFAGPIGGSPNTGGAPYATYYWDPSLARNYVNSLQSNWRVMNNNDDLDFRNSNMPLVNMGYYQNSWGRQQTGKACILNFVQYMIDFYIGNSNNWNSSMSWSSTLANLYICSYV